MGLYYYTSRDVMFLYLERNLIAPEGIVRDSHNDHTIGNASPYGLFITHHRLNHAARCHGISVPEAVYPITLEISDPQHTDPRDGVAILVTKEADGVSYKAASLADYNEETCLGAYLIGEIPWSRVEKVYFDTEGERDWFALPSADIWLPKDRYEILPETFDEELPAELAAGPDNEALLTAIGTIDGIGTMDEILQGIVHRERLRAGMLNAIDGTDSWQMADYRYSIDPVLQELLGLDDAAIKEELPHYAESVAARDADSIEELELLGTCKTADSNEQPDADNAIVNRNQQIYDGIVRVLLRAQVDHKWGQGVMEAILHDIEIELTSLCANPGEKVVIRDTMSDIEGLVTSTGDLTPEQISGKIPPEIDILRALMYVAKNPKSYTDFIRSLEIYRADQRTRRRAMVLWGMINGLVDIPGDGYNKDNRALWQLIESCVAEKAGANITLSVAHPEISIVDHNVLGLDIMESQAVTWKDVQAAILKMPENQLDERFYAILMGLVKVKTGASKSDYEHRISPRSLHLIAGEEITDEQWSILNELKKCKKVPNKEKLFNDYVRDDGVFAKVYDRDPDYWKTYVIESEK